MTRAARRSAIVAAALLGLGIACASTPPAAPTGPARYRLAHSGTHWDVVGEDRVLEDVLGLYPEFFAVVLDPQQTRMPNMLSLREDLEREPVDRRNFDALNAVAIGYFEINYRAESQREDGLVYIAQSQRAAKLLALPWRGYGETSDAALRTAILDFFEDTVTGQKLSANATAARVGPIVASLERKELDPLRVARIRAIASTAEARIQRQQDH